LRKGSFIFKGRGRPKRYHRIGRFAPPASAGESTSSSLAALGMTM
jgi:hypothetical protein